MTEKERVYAAIEFKTPDRVPLFTDSPGFDSDIFLFEWNEIVPWKDWDDISNPMFDHWHCGWTRTDENNMGQVTIHPLEDWEDMESFEWPDAKDPKWYAGMEERLQGKEDKYIQNHIFMCLFERMHSLRGFENTLVDLYVDPEKSAELADRIVNFQIAVIEDVLKRFEGRVDGFAFSDDWGTETGLFINPDMWREFFKPRYKKIFDACKQGGCKVYFHSCGKIDAIIGDLIEIGVDILNLQQIRVYDMKKLGELYAGKVCFATLCDIQKTLPLKGEQEITEEVQDIYRYLGTDQGGIIYAYDDSNNEALNISEEKMDFMNQAFDKFDRWKQDKIFKYEKQGR